MIYDAIINRSRYRQIPNLAQALDYLATLPPEGALPEGAVSLSDQVHINPVCFTTRPLEDCLYEAHRNYIDVHYILSGLEICHVAELDTLSVQVDFDPATDIGFYMGEAQSVCRLTPGQFLVCFPEDAHRVAIAGDGPAPVRKLVAKIAVSP